MHCCGLFGVQLFFQNFEFSQSPQQFLNNLLISFLFTEMKGYLAMRFSYDVLELYTVSKKHACLSLNHVGQYAGHIKKLENDVVVSINKTISTFKIAMANVPREIWNNNPVEHKEGMYIQVHIIMMQLAFESLRITK